MNLTPAEAERFASKINGTGKGCWLWTGPLDKDGYGTFYLRRRGRKAHRVAFYNANGEIPAKQVVDHTCQNRHCVNPDHLRTVTTTENALVNSDSVGARNALKTTCPRGHPYDRRYIAKKTGRYQRYCSICDAAKSKRLRKAWIEADTLNV